MAGPFPVRGVETLPKHLHAFAQAAIDGKGFVFPEPRTGGWAAEDRGLMPEGMTKPAVFAAQMYDAALLVAFYNLTVWGTALEMNKNGVSPRKVERVYAAENRKVIAAYHAAMMRLYAEHGHDYLEPIERRVV